jgi:hypothetical protein
MKRFGALLSGVALLALAACGGETKAPLKAITAAEVDGAAIIAADQRYAGVCNLCAINKGSQYFKIFQIAHQDEVSRIILSQ